MTVNVFTAKPGMIIGRGGAGIEELKKNITEFLGRPCHINVMEIKQPDADAQLVAENIAQQLEKRISFRRAMKQAQQRSMKVPGVKGIKTSVSGRLGGADIARSEHYHEGSIPLQTLRANIDYGFAEAKTTYGRLGIKVWIYKGQILPRAKKAPVGKEGK
jgi:small subunit ribosomal protein S3